MNFSLPSLHSNAGDGLKRLEERQVWDVKYAQYLAELDKKTSPATGDYNVAPQ